MYSSPCNLPEQFNTPYWKGYDAGIDWQQRKAPEGLTEKETQDWYNGYDQAGEDE